ncbi:glycoside hydrolase family 65 protein [Mycolicibacterium sp. CR10]|uniref:glycoside hydrolase family 65 protein n=1 Tax=Mycolicibacterium sp. CR10 TaxID=2562314 RepID=UPI0010BFB026|nr:glycosyl hydrolase family 65 protein [Mycolicibacterium sp. CR10]
MLDDVLSDEAWLVRQSGHDPARANFFETVFTVGNGRLGTRGSLEEGHRGEWSGTYLNGVYDGYDAPVIDLVNAPDWLSLVIHVEGVRLDVQSCAVLEHERALDIARGLVWRRTVFEDSQGRRTRLETLRFASMATRSVCALRYEITAENHSSRISVVSGINGDRRNLERLPAYPHGTTFEPETRWDKWAKTKHLVESVHASDESSIYLEMRTAATDITIGVASSTWGYPPAPVQRSVVQEYDRVAERFDFELAEGEPVRLDKLVTIVTSRDPAAPGCALHPVPDRCRSALEAAADAGFDALLADSVAEWERKWTACDCLITGDPDADAACKAVRFGIYHLLIAANEHDPTVNIGAKSLSGEGYRGHVFWDTEILMLPFFIFTQPDTARALLRYRHHTLPGARENARSEGRRGARYAWESADTGREECPEWTVDGVDRLWMRDEEVHVGADVVYGIMRYVTATGDIPFLVDYGAEILFETSRYWVDRLDYDSDTDLYSLKMVMGPDEFHIHVDDNAFTNALVRYNLEQAVAVYEMLATEYPAELAELVATLELSTDEVNQWRTRAARIVDRVNPDTGLIEQFRGYFDMEDVPITVWDDNDMPQYPEGYHHFNCEHTTLLKQPDVVMVQYLLPDLHGPESKRANFDFYEARTLHKSSLSPSIHAIMGIEVGDFTRAAQYFARSAFVDLNDNQGNTAEGMHIASAGGTWQTVVSGFGGFRVRNGVMAFDPWLPPGWERVGFRLHWHGDVVEVCVELDAITFTMRGTAKSHQTVIVQGRDVVLTSGHPTRVPLLSAAERPAGIAFHATPPRGMQFRR